jgi:hypothetical protein
VAAALVEEGVELALAAVMPGADVTFAFAVAMAEALALALETIDAGAVRMLVGTLDSLIFVGATTIPPPAVVGEELVEVVAAMMMVSVEGESESEFESEFELE